MERELLSILAEPEFPAKRFVSRIFFNSTERITWVLKDIFLQQKKAKKLLYGIFLECSVISENVDV